LFVWQCASVLWILGEDNLSQDIYMYRTRLLKEG
jgi:hypothetical protein